MTKSIMQLDTLSCPSCLQKIETALSNQPGVANVKVLFNASKVKTDFDESTTNADTLADVVRKLGYDVQSIKVKEA